MVEGLLLSALYMYKVNVVALVGCVCLLMLVAAEVARTCNNLGWSGLCADADTMWLGCSLQALLVGMPLKSSSPCVMQFVLPSRPIHPSPSASGA